MTWTSFVCPRHIVAHPLAHLLAACMAHLLAPPLRRTDS